MSLSATDIVAIGGLAVSVSTLALTYATFRWTQRQNFTEVFDLVVDWKWGDPEFGKDRATPFLSCHNRSSRSIFVTKIEYFTRIICWERKGWQGMRFDHPFDNPLPCKIEPDEVADFPVNVSGAIDTVRAVRLGKSLSWMARRIIFVRVTTASGACREINAQGFIPSDVPFY